MRTIGALLLTALLLAGCSSGSDDTSPADSDRTSTTDTHTTVSITTEPTLPSLAPEEIDVSASPYCAQWAEVRRLAGNDISDLDQAGVRAYYAKLVPVVEKLLSTAPTDLRPSVQIALTATQAAAQSGANEEFGTDPSIEAQKKLLTYAYDHCRKR
jgi:hypothetical protein